MGLLSTDQLAELEETGLIGPFSLISSAAADPIRERLDREVLATRSWIYAHTQSDVASMHWSRDRHLDSPIVYRLCSDGAIIQRVASVLGPDLLLWRSDFFVQAASAKYTEPHQDKKFSGMRNIPALESDDGSWPHNITAWIAFTPMSKRGGALSYVPGTHRFGVLPEVPVEDRSASIFGKGTVLEQQYTEAEWRHVEMDAGQFVLFDNLLVHGSFPTQVDRPRVAVSARYVSTRVIVNPGGTATSGHGMDLSRFGSILVAGSCHSSRNVLRAPPIGSCEAALADDVALVNLAGQL
jgi:non-heme Fe2+,alpha-ketoglutarate-dependent halogenase